MKNFANQSSLKWLTKLLLVSFGCCTNNSFSVFSNNNLSFVYDQELFKKTSSCQTKTGETANKNYSFSAGVNCEYGFDGFACNQDGHRVNVAQIWGPTESYLHSMDYSLDPEVQTAELQKLLYPPLMLTDSTGKILHYQINIQKLQTNVNLWWNIKTSPATWGQLAAGVYLPLKHTDYYNLETNLLPLPENIQALLDSQPTIKQELDNLPLLSERNLAGLNLLRSPSSNILGDLHFLLRWEKTLQSTKKPHQSQLSLAIQTGLIVPVASAQDQQLAFAMPKGNDNAVGIPLSASINLIMADQLRLNLSGDVIWSLVETSRRRLRKSLAQGEVLISDQALARREPGNLYRVTGFGEVCSADQIYSASAGWQFLYKAKDRFLNLADEGYDDVLVHNSQRWQRKFYHQGFVGAAVDFKALTEAKIAPKISLTYKFPVAGERTELYHVLSFSAHCNF